MIELRLTDAQGRILQGALEDAATQRPAMTKVYQRLLTEIGRQIRYENFTVPGNDEYTQEEYEKNQEFFEDDGEQKLFLLKDELEEPEEEVMFRDFPHIQFPQSLIDRGFEDQSYRNDASARASYYPEGVTAYPSLDVFVAEEIPGEREYPDVDRFAVCLLLSEGTEDQCTLFSSESETEMLAYVDGILARLKGKADGQIIKEVQAIYRENEERS